MHKSKHPGTQPPTMSSFNHAEKKTHATFGKEGNARKPHEMLKKGTGVKPLPPAPMDGGFRYTTTKPEVPTAVQCEEAYAEARKTQTAAATKNFVTSNAVENILSVPKKPGMPIWGVND
jgi:hypothetical protein